MNKRQVEVQQVQATNEQQVLRQLKQVYTQASKDCATKIQELSSRTDLENLQSIIYQKQYQEAMKKQLDSVVEQLNSNAFNTVADYISTSYEDGFFGTLYDLQGQGIPLIFPYNQEQAVAAVQVDSKISKGLYTKMGEDADYLKKSIRAELSRGVSNGESWNQIAGHIAMGMNSPFQSAYNRTKTIARTEGHRVQQEATLHCQQKAKSKGADVVKQWDSTLDGVTRPSHKALDGQIREIDEPFEGDGGKAMYPGGFGTPSEDCNCRCCLLQRAKWAISNEEFFTKWNGDTGELVKINSKDYNEFKKTAKVMNSSLEYRIVNHNAGDYYVKERVTFLEALTEMPQKVRDALENTVVQVGSEGSAYDPSTNTIYIGKNTNKSEVIHEIGHAIEDKLFDKAKVDLVKSQCVKGLTINDIRMVTGEDSSGNSRNVFIVESDKLINKYQGRLYIDYWDDAINVDGHINTEAMKEFVSVSMEKYFENSDLLKQRNYDMFALIDEVMQ